MDMSTDSTWSELKEQLKYMLDVDGGLLVNLYCNDVVNEEQYRKLEHEKDYVSKTVQILHLTCERQSELFEALNETHQGHITNYICRKGLRPADDDGNWPLYGTCQWSKLKKNLLKLIELTDSYHGLLDEMVQVDCISYQHAKNIDSQKEHSERNKKLFEILKLRSVTAYHCFIDCLLKTSQPHVASLLEPAKGGEVQPLASEFKNRLKSNYSTLIDNIEIHGLLELMFKEKCLNLRQVEAIRAKATTKTSGASLLLEIVLRSSQPNFDCFIRCLINSGQEYLCKLLRSNAISAEIDASSSGVENITETEEILVEKIKSQLSCHTPDEKKRVIRELTDWLSSNDVELLSSQAGHSIRLYFLCRSSAGVQFLRKVYANGDLVSFVQRLFISLLEDTVNIVVEKLDWKEPNCQNCLNHFVSDTSEHNHSADTTKRIVETASTRGTDYDITRCSLCAGRINNPHSLPDCLHTFCYICLDRLWTDLSPGEKVSCPLCRRECVIPAGGIPGYTHDIFIQSILDDITVHGKVTEKNLCEVCTADAERITAIATEYCVDCCQRLCNSCSEKHAGISGDLHLIKELELEPERKPVQQAGCCCTVHKQRPIELYCVDCECNMCMDCLAEKHRHHKCREVDKAADDVRQEIDADVAVVMRCIKEVTEHEVQQQSAVKSFLDNFTIVKKAIRKRCTDIAFFIDSEKLHLLQQLQSVKEQAMKDFKAIEERNKLSLVAMTSFVAYAEELKSKGQACDLTRMGSSIHRRASELSTAHYLPAVHGGPRVAFQATNLYDVLASSSSCNFVGQLMVNADNAGDADQSSCLDAGNFAAGLNHAKEQLARNQKLLLEKDHALNDLKRLLREKDAKLVKIEEFKRKQELMSAKITELIAQLTKVGQISEEETIFVLKRLLSEQKRVKGEKKVEQLKQPISEQLTKVTAMQSKASQLPAPVPEKVKQRKGSRPRSTTGTITRAIADSEGGTDNVAGVTVHDNELFIVRQYPEGRIEVYNATNFAFQRHIVVKELADSLSRVYGLTSCDTNKCIYLSDYIDGYYIHRVELTGKNDVVKWDVKDGGPQGLSVNRARNLIVVCWQRPHRLIEYTTRGALVRRILFQDNVFWPWHAVQLDSGQFLVSHGSGNALHRVCVVDSNGRVLRSYGNRPGSGTGQLNAPRQLAVDKNGFVFVADKENNRIVVLDSTCLTWSRDMRIGGGVVHKPFSLYVDERRDKLLVGECNEEDSRVVDVKLSSCSDDDDDV